MKVPVEGVLLGPTWLDEDSLGVQCCYVAWTAWWEATVSNTPRGQQSLRADMMLCNAVVHRAGGPRRGIEKLELDFGGDVNRRRAGQRT
jgi:hypothetical protein